VKSRTAVLSGIEEVILGTLACHPGPCGSDCITEGLPSTSSRTSGEVFSSAELSKSIDNNKTPLRSNTRIDVLRADSRSTEARSTEDVTTPKRDENAERSAESMEFKLTSTGPLSIAATAAAAAQKRSEKEEKPAEASRSAPANSGPLSIAAAAAAAAQKRNVKVAGTTKLDSTAIGAKPEDRASNHSNAREEQGRWSPSTVDLLGPCEKETPKAGRTVKALFNELESTFPNIDKTGETLGVEDAAGDESTSIETSEQLLEHVREGAEDLTTVDILAALLGHGVLMTRRNPRDVAAFSCLNALISFALGGEELGDVNLFADKTVENADTLIDLSRKCLLRCLSISNQATSTGMTGWLEYGASSPLGRVAERPFSCLHGLGCTYAREGRWDDAEDILRALVSRCEQQLPLYHPTTLTALLDLAAAAMMNNRISSAVPILTRVADRLFYYLSESEDSYLFYLDRSAKKGRPGEARFVLGEGADSILMLTDFANLLQSHLEREMVAILGEDHEIVLLHRSFLADTLSVLANCEDAAKASIGLHFDEQSSRIGKYWRLAFLHYQAAFKGFSKNKGLDDPSSVAAAYGAARCLHALRESTKALELLSTVASALEASLDASKSQRSMSMVATPHEGSSGAQRKSVAFLPCTSMESLRALEGNRCGSIQASRALCLWLMAVLTANRSPGEEGRKESLNLLHGAWKSLQLALKDIPESDESSRDTCIELLRKIEDEAKAVLEIQ